MGYFCLDDYDCIAFDMDHTLIQYDIPELSKLIYQCLVEQLKEKGYDQSLLSLDLYEKHQDLCVKGVIFDYVKGNLIKIDDKGYVLVCSHGFTQLNDAEIEVEYGSERMWSSFSYLNETVSHGPGYAVLENYYLAPAIPLISILVDNADSKQFGRLETYLPLWKDIAQAFDANFTYLSFKARSASYMPALISHPEKYVQKCPQSVINWIKGLRKTKLTALVTHTFENLAEHLMCYAFGQDWKDHFDFIIGYANKPKFFHDTLKDCPFYTMNADEEISKEEVTELEPHKFYLCGSSYRLEKEIQRHLHMNALPKFVYFGDSFKSDIFAPSFHVGWDTVIILRELESEKEAAYWNEISDNEPINKKIKTSHKENELIANSKRWGSFFFHPKKKSDIIINGTIEEPSLNVATMNTFWGGIIQQHSKLAIPLLDYIAHLPVDHKFQFVNDQNFVFYPYPPRSLIQSSA